MKSILTLLPSLFLAASLAACGSGDCDKLADSCARCTDTVLKNACNELVDADDDGVCESNLQSYETRCP